MAPLPHPDQKTLGNVIASSKSAFESLTHAITSTTELFTITKISTTAATTSSPQTHARSISPLINHLPTLNALIARWSSPDSSSSSSPDASAGASSSSSDVSAGCQGDYCHAGTGHLSGGAIAGIVIGALAAVCILAGLVFWWWSFVCAARRGTFEVFDDKTCTSDSYTSKFGSSYCSSDSTCTSEGLSSVLDRVVAEKEVLRSAKSCGVGGGSVGGLGGVGGVGVIPGSVHSYTRRPPGVRSAREGRRAARYVYEDGRVVIVDEEVVVERPRRAHRGHHHGRGCVERCCDRRYRRRI